MQVLVEESSRKYTAFAVPGSDLFQFRKMLFGLVNSPKTFSRLIDLVFGPDLGEHIFSCLNDIIIINEDFENYLKWFRTALERLLEAGLEVNLEKCECCCSSVTYLGYLFDKDGLRPDPEKVKPVLDIPTPNNVKDLRRMLGMFGWYSRFIKDEAGIKIPLVKLLHKDYEWNWGP